MRKFSPAKRVRTESPGGTSGRDEEPSPEVDAYRVARDNLHLAATHASLALVAIHRVIEQAEEQAKQLSEKEKELSALREEALKAKHIADAKDKALAEAEDRAKRAEEIAWSSMASEKDALTKLEQLSLANQQDRIELFNAKTTLEAANAKINQLSAKEVDAVAEAADFGYVCGIAECMRKIKYAEGEDVFEVVKNELIEYVQENPPVADYPLPVGDLSAWGVDLSIFGPNVKIFNPLTTDVEATLDSLADQPSAADHNGHAAL